MRSKQLHQPKFLKRTPRNKTRHLLRFISRSRSCFLGAERSGAGDGQRPEGGREGNATRARASPAPRRAARGHPGPRRPGAAAAGPAGDSLASVWAACGELAPQIQQLRSTPKSSGDPKPRIPAGTAAKLSAEEKRRRPGRTPLAHRRGEGATPVARAAAGRASPRWRSGLESQESRPRPPSRFL